MVNGIDSLTSLSDFLLLAYRNASDFCVQFSLGKFIPRYLILFVAVVNVTDCLTSLIFHC